MNLTFIYVSHKLTSFENEWINTYHLRIKNYAKLNVVRIKDDKRLSYDPKKHMLPNTRLVLMDQKGKTKTTDQFKDWLEKQRDNNTSIVFFIGGSYGIPDSMKDTSHELLSLSAMTLPHRMAFLLLSEQVYRALSMMHGHPYHHE
ncbi:MAG: 23S rRNA (pseudouridine(1915)-N(3))-methyltransferase RlmH [Bdellovibrionales bacterium]|nr:23S rRNA (pseudouridine(1915)-N(3))-methyltransferase RlmH [Bdellovibrionales bacterium]